MFKSMMPSGLVCGLPSDTRGDINSTNVYEFLIGCCILVSSLPETIYEVREFKKLYFFLSLCQHDLIVVFDSFNV